MKYVYVLTSQSVAGQTYVGVTCDLPRRLAEHNAGKCRHTSKYAPWECLKTGSGRAFLKRHFL